MKLRKILTHPIFIIVLSLASSGTFTLFWVIYFTVVLGTYKSMLHKKAALIMIGITLYLMFRVYISNPDVSFGELMIGVTQALAGLSVFIVIAMWFLVPHKLVEFRESVGLEPRISWKIGLLPLGTCFYTIGFFTIHAPSRNLSEATTMAVGVPMIITSVIAMTVWLYIVHMRYNEYVDELEEQEQELRRQRYIRRKKRRKRGKPLDYMTRPIQEDLPPLEFPGYKSDISDNENNLN